MTEPRSPRRDAQENRAGILTAATRLFAEDPAASLDAIARAAGLSRRALYGHFPDRDALQCEVISLGAARFNAIAAGIDEPDPRRALVRLATALWEEASHVHAAASLALDDRHLAATAEALAPLRGLLLSICERGAAEGSLRDDIPPRLTARLVEETVRGVITRIAPEDVGAHLLAIRASLGAAGLSAHEAGELLRREGRE